MSFDRLFPPGFRAAAALAGTLLLVGLAQLGALFFRDDPYALAAAALALLLLGGGSVLAAFIAYNLRRGTAPREGASPADLLTAAALTLVAAVAASIFVTTGIFFPFRTALWFRAADPAEAPLPMMLAGSAVVALGAAATAALIGALWIWLYARGLKGPARVAGAILSFGGAIPYVAFALVIRALVCKPVAFVAAGRFLALRPDEQLAYRSLLGMSPGFLAAALALGLAVGRGLWSWLDQVRLAEESSDSFLTARVRGQKPWQILMRQGLWLRRRRELGALLLGGMAAAVLIDILSNTLIDAFRPPGFPAYPSLGAALFLRGITAGGMPAPLDPAWAGSHVAVVLAALILVLAQTVPQRLRRVSLRNGTLRVNARVLARGVGGVHALPARPSLQWVLGESGAGKSLLLQAWAAQLGDAVLVPQDPDDALPAAFSATDAARLARGRHPRGDRVLWDLLGRLDDQRIRRRLFDPFTSVAAFSRGERQRLAVCLALSRARSDPDCTLLLDEPTSAQDAPRTHALLDCLRELLTPRFEGSGSLVLTSHDPEPVEALLGDRSAEAVTDHLLWLEQGVASSFPVGERRQWQGAAARSAGLQRYFGAIDHLLEARDGPPVSPPAVDGEGVRMLRTHAQIGGRSYAIAPEARVRGGELVVLSGPSGCGKTTLLKEICNGPARAVSIGYLAQDTGRAFPAEMPVREVLGPEPRDELVERWFGALLAPQTLARPIGALSEGERQRVVLAGEVLRLEQARARLRLLLLDEPFGAQDPPGHLRLMDSLLGWLRESRDRAAVLVSHSPLVDLGLARAFGVPAVEWTIAGEAG